MSIDNLIYFAFGIIEFLSEPVKGKNILDRTCHKFLCENRQTNRPKLEAKKFRLGLNLA